ncbi:class I SAM-dependent methyltransferase [Stakelama pacifica]|uniref:Methyltransferase family protein n=1 Tax=Stakelama pacifica TaxID=517720 RepID=A0A4R6FUF4_9SPHN|nr:class I SAM-dependent methyltransferase [Stakelama pacifica]TDN84515.1 methyltransferase family protein [Stakelama pacifica]GGO93583.1 SAM-dependent methyltransferase [Stakelama pacifica]
MSAPEIFSPLARRLRRDRAAPGFSDYRFVYDFMREGIEERLDAVKRDFTDILDLGCWDGSFAPPPGANITRVDPGSRFAEAAGGIQAEEDRLPFAEASFDLVVAIGTLDTVNDLPGALTLIRRALRPDGLFLGAFFGAGSLATLRRALMTAESERPAARIHPQIDVRSAGDLLARAGFALPVADTESLNVRYGDIFGLIRDLRGMAATNVMKERSPLSRTTLGRAAQAFADLADPDGRTRERFEVITVTGWAPDPSQPKPARRGSASASLAEALKARD